MAETSYLLRFKTHEPQSLDDLDIPRTARAISRWHPECTDSVEEWTEIVVYACERAQDAIAEPDDEQEALFLLVRIMKSFFREELKISKPSYERFLAYAYLFRDLMHFLELEVWGFEGEDFDAEDDDLIELKFERAWEKARYGEGDNLLSHASIHANLLPDNKFPDVTNQFERMVVGIAEYLHKDQRKGVIYLPQDRIAETLDTSQQAVSLAIKRLEKKGYLKQMSPPDRSKRRATGYKFIRSPRRKPSTRSRFN